MKESKLNIMLHPIRIRILQTLIGGRRLTVQQINERLFDVPQATLYRHLKILHQIDLIEVVEENKVRGTLERVYQLNEGKVALSPEDVINLTKEEHFNLFFKFLLNQLTEFENCLSNPNFDIVKDGVGYHQANLYLSDEELMELYRKLSSIVIEASKNEPNESRKQRIFSTIMIPKNK